MLAMLDGDALTPNMQLIVLLSGFFLMAAFMGVGFILIYRNQLKITRQFGTVKPLWPHALAELSAVMRHDLEWAKEQDSLMDKVNETPAKVTEQERDRLVELVTERTTATNAEMRPNEQDAAKAYLAVLPLALAQAQSTSPLSSISAVGTEAPKDQSDGDKEAQESAGQ